MGNEKYAVVTYFLFDASSDNIPEIYLYDSKEQATTGLKKLYAESCEEGSELNNDTLIEDKCFISEACGVAMTAWDDWGDTVCRVFRVTKVKEG